MKAIVVLYVVAAYVSLCEAWGPPFHQIMKRMDYTSANPIKCISSSLVSLGVMVSFNHQAFAAAASSPGSLSSPSVVSSTSSSSLSNPAWHRAEFNVPSDDFWYPPFMIGEWNADFKFEEAVFSDKVPLDKLIKEGQVPGLARYSVLMVPNVGEDVDDVKLRFVQLDSHPREDHSFNTRQLLESFSRGGGSSSSNSEGSSQSNPRVHVDAAPYHYQKAPDWFHSPANTREVVFHEEGEGEGEGGKITAKLRTLKRDIATFAGRVETVEFIRQTLTVPGKAPVVSDYALDWQFSVPASLRDEFLTVDDLRKSDAVVGRLHIFVYLSPTNDLYTSLSGQPVGVYKYVVNMKREAGTGTEAGIDGDRGTADTVYPFVWRDAGAVELKDYFGY